MYSGNPPPYESLFWDGLRWLSRLAISPRGAYAAETSYVPGDTISVDGILYRCLTPTLGNAPPSPTYWEVFVQGGGVAVPIPIHIFAGAAAVGSTTPTRVAASVLSLANFPDKSGSKNRQQTFEVTFEVTSALALGHAYLYNVTRSEVVAARTFTTRSLAPDTQSLALTAGTGAGELRDGDTYELDLWITEAPSGQDRVICTHSALQVTYA